MRGVGSMAGKLGWHLIPWWLPRYVRQGHDKATDEDSPVIFATPQPFPLAIAR